MAFGSELSEGEYFVLRISQGRKNKNYHPQFLIFFLKSKQLTYDLLMRAPITCWGLRNLTEPGVLCRAGHRGSQRLGVCKDISQCRGALYDGFCRNGLGVCCFGKEIKCISTNKVLSIYLVEEYKCGGITGDSVSYFQVTKLKYLILICDHSV